MRALFRFVFHPLLPVLILLLGQLIARGEAIMIKLSDIAGSNIPNVKACVSGTDFHFQSTVAKPDDGDYFYVRYNFSVPTDGKYRLVLGGRGSGSGCFTYSRYSYVIDNDPAKPALRRERVITTDLWILRESPQDPMTLKAGTHTLELRFAPEQRMRAMNRANEPYTQHNVLLQKVWVEPVTAAPKPELSRLGTMQLRPGDSVVLFGDSITEEGTYAKNILRMLDQAFPGHGITLYNSGIALNRSWEGVERMDLDVIALHPTWAVIAFGVNDAMHMPPEEFRKQYETILSRLHKAGIKVLCGTPSGMFPDVTYKTSNLVYTVDLASGFDRNAIYESQIIQELANKYGYPCADVFGAFDRAGISRFTLMGNQWHPGEEGGRMYALALLRALGFSREDVARTKEPKDLEYFTALEKMPVQKYPEHKVKAFVHGPLSGKIIFTSAFAESAVYAFSVTGEPLACIPVDYHPMGLAYSSKHKALYVTCKGSGRIDVISLPSGKVTGTIPLGDVYPLSIVLTADENTAWVGNYFGSSVMEIDLAKQSIARTITLPGVVNGIYLTPDQHTLLASFDGKVAIINTKSGTVEKTLEATQFSTAIITEKNGKPGILDTSDWSLRPIDLQTQTILAASAKQYPARAVAIDPQTGDVWAGNCFEQKLIRILPDGKVQQVAAVDFPMGITVCTLP